MTDKVKMVHVAQTYPNRNNIETPVGQPFDVSHSDLDAYIVETGKISHSPDGHSNAVTATVYRGPTGRTIVNRG